MSTLVHNMLFTLYYLIYSHDQLTLLMSYGKSFDIFLRLKIFLNLLSTHRKSEKMLGLIIQTVVRAHKTLLLLFLFNLKLKGLLVTSRR